MEEEIKVGQVWRDTYDDGVKPGSLGKRTIRIIEIINGTHIRADVATDHSSNPPKKPRVTTLKVKTLRAGYELVEEPAQ